MKHHEVHSPIQFNAGIVVIGRNEGDRLRACLNSIRESSLPCIYVDSGSSDNSLGVARSLGIEAYELDSTKPYSAARARNEGFLEITKSHHEIQFIQFLDGDCTLQPGWLERAEEALQADTARAAVIGHLQEIDIAASPFNRLCALEWQSEPGDLENFGGFGGISMVRVDVFRELGGFNEEVIAGEDSELGARICLAGYKITKLDYPMAAHNADIRHFSQWWKRAVRAGHAIGQRADLNGRSRLRDCVKERRSTWFWGVGIPVIVILFLVPSDGLSLLLLLGYIVLGIRVFRFRLRQGDSVPDARLYAIFLLLAKFANGVGLCKFYLNKFFHRYEIIEYK